MTRFRMDVSGPFQMVLLTREPANLMLQRRQLAKGAFQLNSG